MIAIKKIKKVLKFAGSLIGKIIFSLIAIIVIGLLVYILATTILKSIDNKQVFVLGHLEYDKFTLKNEYERDKAKNLPIDEPINYFNEDKSDVDVLWRSTANILYSNWLNYYVYQITPFDFKSPKIKYQNE